MSCNRYLTVQLQPAIAAGHFLGLQSTKRLIIQRPIILLEDPRRFQDVFAFPTLQDKSIMPLNRNQGRDTPSLYR